MPKRPTSRWALAAQPIIARLIAAHLDASEDELRKLISAAYPFGPREMHPYKEWLQQVRASLNLRFRGKITRERPPKTLPPTPLF